MCSPVPLAISSTNPFGGRTARKTSRMGPRLRARIGAPRYVALALAAVLGGSKVTVHTILLKYHFIFNLPLDSYQIIALQANCYFAHEA
jgi:hypothetical protein